MLLQSCHLGESVDICTKLENDLVYRFEKAIEELNVTFESGYNVRFDKSHKKVEIVVNMNKMDNLYLMDMLVVVVFGEKISELYVMLLKNICDYCNKLKELFTKALCENDLETPRKVQKSKIYICRPLMEKICKIRQINDDLVSKSADVLFMYFTN